MNEQSVIYLAVLVCLYSFCEFFLKRILWKPSEAYTSGMAAKQAAVLWLTLLIGTLGFQSIALAVGVTLIAVVYTFTGRRPAERMLEKFLLTQLLMGVLLYILWRIIQPISVHDWYAKIEDVVLAQSADVLRVRLPLILGIVAAYLFIIDGGTRIVKGILGKFPGLYQRVVKALEEGDGNGEASPVSEENVGEWIGILERIITLTLVLPVISLRLPSFSQPSR
jgi:hypothetical protein